MRYSGFCTLGGYSEGEYGVQSDEGARDAALTASLYLLEGLGKIWSSDAVTYTQLGNIVTHGFKIMLLKTINTSRSSITLLASSVTGVVMAR